jgi:hypothetical protein
MSNETVKVRVVLKSGDEFIVNYNKDHGVAVDSFSEQTLHQLIVEQPNGKLHKVLVRGDNIAYFESRGE